MKKIAIYGAGAFGRLFYKALDAKVDFFVDDYWDHQFIFDIPIKKLSDIPKSTTIYISILQHSKKIEQTLQKEGFKNIINFTSSIKLLPNILSITAKANYLWLVDDTKKMIDEEKLELFSKLLSDQKSLQILNNITMLRKTLDPKYYIDPSDTEYFPCDVPILDNLKIINFIDCGAYIGDTIEELMKQSTNVNYTLSFEPDQKNLLKLQEQIFLLKQKFHTTNFFAYPAGVYSTNDILKFANNGIDSSASFDDNSTLEVPVVSLDTIILNSDPNFIKMDIEGAEKEAIIGAKKTIQKYKPNLAICLYHRPEDLWELPLLIHEIEPSYDMYLRVHEDMCLSTVLYCISKG
jgi:FkbM family methyltransferase